MINFFKRFRKKIRESEYKEELILIDNIEEKINELVLRIEKEEELVLKKAGEEINLLDKELKEKIRILREINLENRREDARLKERVLDGKENYIICCEKFLREILTIERDHEDFFRKINFTVARFEKESFKVFEVATIFIGQEIHEARDVVIKFFRNQEKIYNENKDVFIRKKLLSEISEKNKFLKDLKSNRNNLEAEVRKFKSDFNEKIILQQKKNIEVLDLKKTNEYKKLIEDKKRVEEKKLQLIRDANNLKNQMNLKEMMGIYYKNEKYRELIGKYRDNFMNALIEDKEDRFFAIVTKENAEDLKKIREEFIELNQNISSEIGKKEHDIFSEISHIESEISATEKQIEGDEKRLLKIKIKEEEEMSKLKGYLMKFGIKIIENI